MTGKDRIPYFVDPVQVRLTQKDAHVLVADVKNRVVATANGIEEHESLHICSLAVDPHYQGWGIAYYLMKELEKLACQLGCHKLFLQTAWSMTEAIELYKSLGYVQEGYQSRQFYGEDFLLFGKLLD